MKPLGEKIHFIGAAGAGMSALAQFHVMAGDPATGSDRTFDQGGAPELKAQLERLGVLLFPQDGSALNERPARAVASTAVEDGNADLIRAKQSGIPVVHRADWLAGHVERYRTIAVGGTSGKSTVAAMIYEILDSAGASPSIITGGALNALKRRGIAGNAFRGESDLLVVEADESDGTVVRYRPWLGVLLNLSKDHKEVADVKGMFRRFREHSSRFAVRAGPSFEEFAPGSVTFGLSSGDVRAANIEAGAEGSRFSIGGVPFTLPAPGLHNIENAVAAVTACREAGVVLEAASKALAGFQGVARRFERVGAARGVEVIDDFAHNPAKVEAALAAAHLRAKRVLVVFQLHGYAPARFMKQEFIDSFASALASRDILWMPEIYYAGGTAAKDISAKDIVDAVAARGKDARYFKDRAALVPELAKAARPGDLILIMGARDPSLGAFARAVLSALTL